MTRAFQALAFGQISCSHALPARAVNALR